MPLCSPGCATITTSTEPTSPKENTRLKHREHRVKAEEQLSAPQLRNRRPSTPKQAEEGAQRYGEAARHLKQPRNRELGEISHANTPVHAAAPAASLQTGPPAERRANLNLQKSSTDLTSSISYHKQRGQRKQNTGEELSPALLQLPPGGKTAGTGGRGRRSVLIRVTAGSYACKESQQHSKISHTSPPPRAVSFALWEAGTAPPILIPSDLA